MSPLSILVVDDHPLNLKLMKVMLGVEGHHVMTAATVSEARARIAALSPDLILMDVQLPDVDGLTFTRELRNNPDTSGLKIIAVTAYAMKGDDEKALDAGCDGYVSKPVDAELLKQTIARVMGDHGKKVEL